MADTERVLLEVTDHLESGLAVEYYCLGHGAPLPELLENILHVAAESIIQKFSS